MPQAKKAPAKKTLRTLPAEFKGIIYQSNRITNAKYDFSLIQERIFNAIMFQLRDPINQLRNGASMHQLELFSTENIEIHIPLMAICKPAYYKKVRETISEMARIPIEIPHTYKNQPGKIIDGLLSAWVPDGRTRSGEIVVKIEPHIAKMLVEIDKNIHGIPCNYTTYMIGVCLQAKNKYTPRIYKFISSWKNKPGTKISLEDFKDMLQLGEKYPTYRDIKKRILLPVSKELKELADCSFNCNTDDFTVRDGKKVVGLNFKIFTISTNLRYVKQEWDTLRHMLSMSLFRFTANDIKELEYLKEHHLYAEVRAAFTRIHEYLFGPEQNHRGKKHIQAYVIESIKREFPPVE